VACELFGTWVGDVTLLFVIGVPTGLPVLFVLVDTLVQEMSYCETPFPLLFGFACAVLYAVPPLPPLPPFRLTVPGSLWTEPGDVAELPGLDVLPWQLAPWGLGLAYAGAAPITAMVTMQLAESSLCLIFTLRFWVRRGAHPTGYTMSMGIWFNDVPGVLDYGAAANFVVRN